MGQNFTFQLKMLTLKNRNLDKKSTLKIFFFFFEKLKKELSYKW